MSRPDVTLGLSETVSLLEACEQRQTWPSVSSPAGFPGVPDAAGGLLPVSTLPVSTLPGGRLPGGRLPEQGTVGKPTGERIASSRSSNQTLKVL